VNDVSGTLVERVLSANDNASRAGLFEPKTVETAAVDAAIAVLGAAVAEIGELAARAEAHAAATAGATPVMDVVVAVRGLAERSARATVEIKALLRASSVGASETEFVARMTPAIQALVNETAELRALMEKAGLPIC
jgi:hypothetical protein